MKKKQIIIGVEFDNKKITYPVDFEDAKDRNIAEVIAKRLLMIVDRFRQERLDKLKVDRAVKEDLK